MQKWKSTLGAPLHPSVSNLTRDPLVPNSKQPLRPHLTSPTTSFHGLCSEQNSDHLVFWPLHMFLEFRTSFWRHGRMSYLTPTDRNVYFKQQKHLSPIPSTKAVKTNFMRHILSDSKPPRQGMDHDELHRHTHIHTHTHVNLGTNVSRCSTVCYMNTLSATWIHHKNIHAQRSCYTPSRPSRPWSIVGSLRQVMSQISVHSVWNKLHFHI